jgi:hypothetical protein
MYLNLESVHINYILDTNWSIQMKQRESASVNGRH